MNEDVAAYNALEGLADEAFAKYGVKLFADLPKEVQADLMQKQEKILLSFGVTHEDFNNPTPFIGAD